VLGFFISDTPSPNTAPRWSFSGIGRPPTLGMWSEQKVYVAAVVTALKRQISKKAAPSTRG